MEVKKKSRRKRKTNEERLHEAASAALDSAIAAIDQIGYAEVETKKTIRKETNDPNEGKVITTEEEKMIRLVEAGIDVSSLKQITATLKDIKDVLGGDDADRADTGVILLPEINTVVLPGVDSAVENGRQQSQ